MQTDVVVFRVLGALAGLYGLLALATRLLERAGIIRCHCGATCWCQRPVLSAFRWILPWGHR
ncbi:MAG TPA: hypothetical protein VIT65_08110 [Microlunatus sp.]